MNLDVTLDARQLVDSILGGQYLERWPEAEYLALQSGRVLSYTNRITLGTFFETVGKRGAAVRARVMRAPASRAFESPEGTYLPYVLVTSGGN